MVSFNKRIVFLGDVLYQYFQHHLLCSVVQACLDIRSSSPRLDAQAGSWSGVAVGGVAGILFPVSLIGSAIVGGVAGGLLGHLWRGMSRGDMKELGEALDEGQAALVVIGRSELAKKIEKATSRAQKRIEKQLKVNAKDFERARAAPSKEAL